jgi:protein-S-isoprenylcysteine O-methyltransferase Ste14
MFDAISYLISVVIGEGHMMLTGERPLSPFVVLFAVIFGVLSLLLLWQSHREKRVKAEAAAEATQRAVQEAIYRIVGNDRPEFQTFNLLPPLLGLVVLGFLLFALLGAWMNVP